MDSGKMGNMKFYRRLRKKERNKFLFFERRLSPVPTSLHRNDKLTTNQKL
jgi:hypothetical protein